MSFNSAGSSGANPEIQAAGISMAGNDSASSRIFSLDVLRGIALLGILVISIWEFGGFTANRQTFFRTGTHGGNYRNSLWRLHHFICFKKRYAVKAFCT
jgi:uncharacterized membrane protein YeiB